MNRMACYPIIRLIPHTIRGKTESTIENAGPKFMNFCFFSGEENHIKNMITTIYISQCAKTSY